MAKSNWNADNIPDQKGKIVIITGATSGLGKEAARVLAGKGATVVMAVRNVQKGSQVAEEIQSGSGELVARALDLSSLESIKTFAEKIIEDFDKIDILINNAGVMMCPFSKTEDGFEIQMGTNHFGHFALTGQLMPLLKKTIGSRVVATASLAHTMGNINFSDINWEKRKYNTNRAYGDSKIANLYFAYELAEKRKSDPSLPIPVAAHPGWTRTDLQRHSGLMRFLNTFFSQGPEMGVLPTLRAAVDPDVVPGDYYGPSRFFEMQGNPVKVKSNDRSKNQASANKLWEMSEEMTGIHY